MDHATHDELKKALESERERLARELRGIARPHPGIAGEWDATFPRFEPDSGAPHASQNEEADEVEEYENRLAAETSLETRMLEVSRALERMTQGAYGICAQCKKPIPMDRLRANPAAEYDIEHATRA